MLRSYHSCIVLLLDFFVDFFEDRGSLLILAILGPWLSCKQNSQMRFAQLSIATLLSQCHAVINFFQVHPGPQMLPEY